MKRPMNGMMCRAGAVALLLALAGLAAPAWAETAEEDAGQTGPAEEAAEAGAGRSADGAEDQEVPGAPSEDEDAAAKAADQAIEDILNQPLGAEEYGSEERCLSSRVYDRVDVLDDQHVVFHGSRDRIWLNTLRNRCLGLRRNDILKFDIRGNRICSLDTFEGVSSFHWGMTSAICSLGTFTPITREQLEAIELAVEEERKRK